MSEIEQAPDYLLKESQSDAGFCGLGHGRTAHVMESLKRSALPLCVVV